MTPTRQERSPETHCPHCGTRVYPTDAHCIGCGRRVMREARESGDVARANEGASPTDEGARPATTAAADKAAAAPSASVPAPRSGNRVGTSAVRVECPRAGCSGRIRVPTNTGAEGTLRCPLCRKTHDYVLGRALEVPRHDTSGKGALRWWELRYAPLPAGSREAVLQFMGPAELQVRPGDEFAFVYLRTDPTQNVLRNVTLDREFVVRPAPGCFPVLIAMALAVVGAMLAGGMVGEMGP